MSKRFKDLKEGDHIFIIEQGNYCPEMTEAIVISSTYRDKENVYLSVKYKGVARGFPCLPAEQSLVYIETALTISTNRERATSYHKKTLRSLLSDLSENIVREMRASEEILHELRKAEKISHGKE